MVVGGCGEGFCSFQERNFMCIGNAKVNVTTATLDAPFQSGLFCSFVFS